MLIYENLYKWKEEQPDKICLINGSLALTYIDFADKIDFLAYRLACSAPKGSKVIIKLHEPIMQLCYFIGAARAGLASVLIDPSTPLKVLEDIVNTIEPDLFITEDFILPCNTTSSLPLVESSDFFLGALSSGSTGTPKLIWRDHQSWTAAFAPQSEVFGISCADRLFVTGSLVYTANLNSCLHMLHEGGTVVIASTTLPRTWISEISQNNVSTIFMVPTNYRILLKSMKEPLYHIQSLVSAGSKMDIITVKSLREKFPNAQFCEYYGASELGHVSYALTEALLKHPDSVGKAFPGVNMWLDSSGLIWVESPYIAPFYKPKATIGDMGRIDDEGYLYLLGRETNVINKGGNKIIPEQVEKILSLCPGVTEAAVRGIDDELRGQRVAAWVVRSNQDLSTEHIRAFCLEHLSRHACPQEIYFTGKLPRNINGKLDYKKLLSGQKRLPYLINKASTQLKA
ncbi:MAG: AMP-binding protein [Clostridia bacterium]|nr:AMP-binding protein [Clostridia bacterium]